MVTCNMKVHKSLPVSSALHDVKNIKRFPTYLKIVICILCVYSFSRIHRLKYIFSKDLIQVNHSTVMATIHFNSLWLHYRFHIFCPYENYNLQNTQMKCQSKIQEPFWNLRFTNDLNHVVKLILRSIVWRQGRKLCVYVLVCTKERMYLY